MFKNYVVTKSGFTVKGAETQHILAAKFVDNTYLGIVTMPEQDEQLTLATWKEGERPFKNDNCFEGAQTTK